MDGHCSGPSIIRIYRRELHRSQQWAVSKHDVIFRIRIAKKEASESMLWLRLLEATSQDDSIKTTLRTLFQEADELTRILATILRNSLR